MDVEVTSIIVRKISWEWNFGIIDGQRIGFNEDDEPDDTSSRSYQDLFKIGGENPFQ